MKFLKKLFRRDARPPTQAEVIVELRSPACPFTAFVEQDDRVVYLYLQPDEGTAFPTKTCWVRNLTAAPSASEVADKRERDPGQAPLMPAEHCRHPQGMPPLEAERASLLWLEEGDGVVLFYDDAPVAVIPAWGGLGGFQGYAAEAIGQGLTAWELGTKSDIHRRIAAAQDFYNDWEDEPNPWQKQQDYLIAVYEEAFGSMGQYYAIDGGDWPPRGLYTRRGKQFDLLATVGTSLLPMPQAEMYVEDDAAARRIEVGMMLPSGLSTPQFQQLINWVSGSAGIPWSNVTWLGAGHTIHCDALRAFGYESVLLYNELEGYPSVLFDRFRDAPVQFLWAIPITAEERSLANAKGVDTLLAVLRQTGPRL